MTVHKVVMRLPNVDVDGRDVEFVVQIDGKKKGTLRVSKGDLEWLPTRRRKQPLKASWGEFIEWMQSGG